MLSFLYWAVVIVGNLTILYLAIYPYAEYAKNKEEESLSCYLAVGFIHAWGIFCLLFMLGFLWIFIELIETVMILFSPFSGGIRNYLVEDSLIFKFSIISWEFWTPIILLTISYAWLCLTYRVPLHNWKRLLFIMSGLSEFFGKSDFSVNLTYLEKQIYGVVGFVLYLAFLAIIFNGCSNLVFQSKVF